MKKQLEKALSPLEKSKVETTLKNALDEIRDRPTAFKRTLEGICTYDGKVYVTTDGKTVKSPIDSFSHKFILTAADLNNLDAFITKVKDVVVNHEKEIVASFKGKSITCYELSDWVWLQWPDGNLLHWNYDPTSDTYEYSITLVKYAKYLED